MNYFDLLAMDRYHAFQGWVSVSQAKAMEIIPEKYRVYFPDYCECGSENIIKVSLKQAMCCNPKCKCKVGFALAEMIKNFGCKGLAETSCTKIYNMMQGYNDVRKEAGLPAILETDSYVELFAVMFNDYPMQLRSTAMGVSFASIRDQMFKQRLTFPKLIGMLGIPSVGSNAEKLFAGIDDFESLLAALKQSGGLMNFCLKRGVADPMVMFNLEQSIMDIVVAWKLFGGTLRKVGMQRLDVCITGILTLDGKRITEHDFVEACNAVCTTADNVQLYEIKSTSATKSAPFIIYSTPSSSAKFRAGKSRGIVRDEFGEHSVLITTDDFIKLLKERVLTWTKEMEENSQIHQSTEAETKAPELVPISNF